VVPLAVPAPELAPVAQVEAFAVPAIDPVVPTSRQAQGPVSTTPPAAVPVISPAPAVAITVAPPPVQMPVLPEGLVELSISLGDLSFDQNGARIRMEGESLVLTGDDLVLTGDLEIRVRLEDGATGSVENGVIRGSFEFVDEAGVTYEIRLRGELVDATVGGGATTYRFEGVLRVSGGGSVPFSTDVTVPGQGSSLQGAGVQAPTESPGAGDETAAVSGQDSPAGVQGLHSEAPGAGDTSGAALTFDPEAAPPESFLGSA
ncbi:MAG: hypothetical protein AAB289_09470, partial [Chloroflexota bacterium]